MEKMYTMTNEMTRNWIKFLPFHEVVLWDVKRYASERIKSDYPIVKLGLHIQEESHKVKLFDFAQEKFGILGVNNKRGIFDAYKETGANINQAYKKMEVGWLAYNPYRVNVGSIGMRTKENQHEFISPAYVVFSCKETLIPDFLYKLFKTERFNKIINESTTGSVRQNLTVEILKSLDIALPKTKEQEEILNNYYKSISISEKYEEEALKLKKQIDDFVFEFLCIDRIEPHKNNKGLNFIRASFLKKWGVDGLLNSNSKGLLNSTKFENKPLSLVTYINPTTSLKDLKTDDEMTFLPMECISDDDGIVIEKRIGLKANSQGYTKFKDNDLIWARITPCMENGKSAIVRDLLNGIGYGSTEFHVIRQKDSNFLIEFVYHLLRLEAVRQDATTHFTGSAGQQRVPKSFLENLVVPVPPLSVQLDFISIIDKMKGEMKTLVIDAENNRKQAIKEFEKAIFKN
jgi:type I restriction enzyme, S subunit